MLSKTCTYGLQAMIYLASVKDPEVLKEKERLAAEAPQASEGQPVAEQPTQPPVAATLPNGLRPKRVTYKKDEFMSVEEIAANLNVSFHFLKKILQTLAEEGVLRTSRGAGGGVKFARPVDQISIYDVIAAVDGEKTFKECILKLSGCGHENPCPLHASWSEEREKLAGYLKGVSLLEAGRNYQKGMRLAYDTMMY
jgi:Rrf2 family iron-sulfur cluster assembly transcriptional regulator